MDGTDCTVYLWLLFATWTLLPNRKGNGHNTGIYPAAGSWKLGICTPNQWWPWFGKGKLLCGSNCAELSKGNNKILPSLELVICSVNTMSLSCELNAVRCSVGFSSVFTKSCSSLMFNSKNLRILKFLKLVSVVVMVCCVFP